MIKRETENWNAYKKNCVLVLEFEVGSCLDYDDVTCR